MNEYGYFKEILDGLRNVITIDDTKKEIQELKDRTINTKLPPKAMQDEFKSLIAELIKRDYISIVDVYNLR